MSDNYYDIRAIAQAIRSKVQIRFDPNAIEIAQNGGANWLTASEAEYAASIAIDTLRSLGWSAPGEVPNRAAEEQERAKKPVRVGADGRPR